MICYIFANNNTDGMPKWITRNTDGFKNNFSQELTVKRDGAGFSSDVAIDMNQTHPK